MRLILWAIIKLDNKPIDKAKTSIGIRLRGLKEKLNPSDKVRPISRLATREMTTSSIDAMINDIKHCIKE